MSEKTETWYWASRFIDEKYILRELSNGNMYESASKALLWADDRDPVFKIRITVERVDG